MVDKYRVTGSIGNLWPNHQLHYRSATAKPKDFISLWINHVFLQLIDKDNCPKTSILLANDGIWQYNSIVNPEPVALQLIEYYNQGQIEPLKFFSQSSWTFAENFFSSRKTQDQSVRQALRNWDGDDFTKGESSDPYYECAFRALSPIDQEFIEIATSFFSQFFQHCSMLK